MLKLLIFIVISVTLFQQIKSQISIPIDDLLQNQNALSSLLLFLQPPPISENISERCALQLNQFYQGLRNMEFWAIESKYI